MAITNPNNKVTASQLNEVVGDITNKADARFVKQETGKGLSTNDYDAAAKQKLDGIDSASTEAEGLVQLSSATDSASETAAATPKAVKAVAEIANSKAAAADVYTKTETYTKTEVEDKIDAAIGSVYKPGGSLAPAAVVAALLVEANEGKVYNLSDTMTLDETTAALFVDGAAGDVLRAGDNIVVKNDGTAESPSYKFDKMAGFIDTSDFAHNADVEVATAADIQAIKDGIWPASGD